MHDNEYRPKEQHRPMDRRGTWYAVKKCFCHMLGLALPQGYVEHNDYGDEAFLEDDGGTQRQEGYCTYPEHAADPLAGGYTSPLTLTRSSAMVFPGPSELMAITPFIRTWDLHVPTDRVTPQYPALGLARGLQVVDSCTPNTDWQHNYGYLEIQDTQTPALETPRYSYASIDQNDLLDEARARVMRTLG